MLRNNQAKTSPPFFFLRAIDTIPSGPVMCPWAVGQDMGEWVPQQNDSNMRKESLDSSAV